MKLIKTRIISNDNALYPYNRRVMIADVGFHTARGVIAAGNHFLPYCEFFNCTYIDYL